MQSSPLEPKCRFPAWPLAGVLALTAALCAWSIWSALHSYQTNVVVGLALAIWLWGRVVRNLWEGRRKLVVALSDRIRAEEALRKEQENLEARVRERTTRLADEVRARQEIEEALSQSEQKYRSLFESSSDAFMISDREVFVDCNPAAGRLFGYSSREEILGKHPSELSPRLQPGGEDSAKLLESRMGAAYATGRQFFEWMHQRQDGTVFATEVLLNRIPINGKSVIQGMIRDISERKRVQEALYQSQERLSLALEAAAMGVWEWDIRTNGVFWSPESCRIIGGNGHKPTLNSFIDLVLPEDRPRIQQAMDASLANRSTFAAEFRVVLPGGRVRWLANVGRAHYGAGGKPLRMIGTVQDITDRKEAEAKMAAMHRELVEISRQAGMAEVASSVLHNVGNVLNSVNVSSSLTLKKIRTSKVQNLTKVAGLIQEHLPDLSAFLADDPKGKQLPNYLSTLAAHLTHEREETLHELTSLAHQIEHIKEIVAMQQAYAGVAGVVEILSLKDLVEDALQINEAGMERHAVRVVREYDELPPVSSDKHKILQILINLIRNAKYALDEGNPPEKRLIVRTEPASEGKVKVLVIDNGIGIPEENLTRIFAHGFTTRKGGHGFGLHHGALAAKQLGGALSAESLGPGQGTTFILELPCQHVERSQ